MKKYLLISCLLIYALCLAGCSDVDSLQNNAQEASLRAAHAQLGMPTIINFQERKLMKMILEMRDKENLITYTYLVNHMTGKPVFLGKSIGYGLPYATQYTNPQKYYMSGGVLPQADPNGLFSPTSSQGTWVCLIDPKTGTPKVVYIEPEVIVSPFPLN
jgi:hypothetical protein